MFVRLAVGLGGLAGPGRWLAALLLGGLGAAAMPPWHVLPAIVVSIVGLVWLLDGASTSRQALATGWLWGFGHFAAGCYWIVEAYFVPPADFAALGPPMVLALAILLGAFVAVACLFSSLVRRRWLRSRSGVPHLLLLAVAFSITEQARSWVLTGFPWNPLGQVWAFADSMLQSASLWGIDGLGLVSFLMFALPAVLGMRSVGPISRFLLGLGLPLTMGLALYAFGAWRLASTPPADTGVVVRVVQPNIPQGEKWRPDLRELHLRKLVQMTLQPAAVVPRLLIWPETAVPFALDLAPEYLRWLGSIVPENGYLLTGAPRTADPPPDRPAPRYRPQWNSLVVIDAAGRNVASYDKAHLVPFGEYLPLRRTWPLLGDTIGRGSFEAGPGPRSIALPGLPTFAPIICYEAIFSGEVADRNSRPAWLLNITNDSWFGTSSGPYQHLTSARLRAIEEGLPMIRVANTGVSASIDAYGRVLSQIGMDRAGVIDVVIPGALPATWFVSHGAFTWTAMLLIFTIFGCLLTCHRVVNPTQEVAAKSK